MLVSIRKVTNLELVGDISNDVNRDQYILINVEPVETVEPVDPQKEQVVKVAVHNGLAFVIPAELAKQVISQRNDTIEPAAVEVPA